jgi:hypothetical protein
VRTPPFPFPLLISIPFSFSAVKVIGRFRPARRTAYIEKMEKLKQEQEKDDKEKMAKIQQAKVRFLSLCLS